MCVFYNVCAFPQSRPRSGSSSRHLQLLLSNTTVTHSVVVFILSITIIHLVLSQSGISWYSTLCTLLYRPLKYKELHKWLFLAGPSYDHVLIVGDLDFNVHVCCPDKPLVKEFLSLIDSFNLVPSVAGPTHEHRHTLHLSHSPPVSNVEVTVWLYYVMLCFHTLQFKPALLFAAVGFDFNLLELSWTLWRH